MSDDRDSNVVQLPSRGNGSGSMPEAPNIDGLFYTEPPEEPLALPPESPEETTMELPPIPRPMDPEMALASEGFPVAPGIDDELGENSDGEYVQRRSLAERIGDWLEYRIAVGQARMEGEAPYKEAEIARKVELLNARTAREVGLLEQQNKLRQAQVQARTARAAAQGKGEAAGSKSGGGSSASGLGRDKGGRKPTSSGSGGSGKGPGGGRGTGMNNSGGAGSRGRSNGSGGANSPKGAGKGPGGPSGGRNGAGKGKDPSGGSRGRKNGPGGSGDSGGSGKGKELSGGSRGRKNSSGGSGDSGGSGKGSSKAERAKAKADRAQAKRTREEAKQQEEEAKRQKGGTKPSGRTTLGQAVGEEAQRRWDKRRSQESVKPEAAGEPKAEDGTEGKPRDVPTDGTKPPKSGPAGTAAPSGPDGSTKSNGGPSDGPDAGDGGTPKDRTREDGTPKGGPASGSNPTADGPGWPGNREETPEWVGREGRKPQRPAPDEYIPDAEIIVPGLPPAPEPHTERPGTSRPAEKESNVGSKKPPASTSGGLAAQHRTNVTFDEYLVDIANIALASGSDKDEAKAIATVTGKIADRLREMAADLGNDHNIDTRIIDLISDLADAAGRMQQQAERCAENCEIAADAAGLAAVGVARTYREDLDAMDAGGVTHASAAAHH